MRRLHRQENEKGGRSLAAQASKAPLRPGVYTFRDSRGTVLYIGKAANLRTRLRSYFTTQENPPAKRALLERAKRIEWQETTNDIEALILEAQLIKTYHPRYNVVLRDDKNYFFVGFTNETLPRVFLTHQPHGNAAHRRTRGGRQPATYLGPFTDGRAIKRTLRLLRRIFPYATHPGFPKRCLEYDLGLCPIPPGDPESCGMERGAFTRRYRKNIRAVQEVLMGKRQALTKRLAREMRAAAEREDFSTAAQRRDEIRGLERIFAHRTVLSGTPTLTIAEIPLPLRPLTLHRIEGYDIANLARGKAATGSMVVFTDGAPDPPQYRHFRIKGVEGANDPVMIAEVLRRRSRHGDWPMPDLVLVDGGRAQLHAAIAALRNFPPTAESGQRVADPKRQTHGSPVTLALAKQNEEIYLPGRATPLRLPKNHPFLLLLMHVRDEAHRFARRYHHTLLRYGGRRKPQ